MSKYCTDKQKFRDILKESKRIVVLTGAGISAESGIPTFRGEGGLWRNNDAMKLATPEAFSANPSLVWQFYQYRRETVLEKKPNQAHYQLVKCEEYFNKNNKKFTLITQNVDGLHLVAGSKNVIQMHGNIMEIRCTKCKNIEYNTEKLVDSKTLEAIPLEELPKCKSCAGLMRPNVVWFNESLDRLVMKKIHDELYNCDLFLIVGTSGVVYPAAGFGSIVSSRNVPIAEFNIDPTPGYSDTTFYFKGKSGETLPDILNIDQIM